MLDSEIEFDKIKKFFSHNPKVIENDSEIKENYLKLIKKLKRKKVIERTEAKFGE